MGEKNIAENISQEKMKNLPDSEIYEQEYEYFPWSNLIDKAVDESVQRAPQGGSVVDLMCGPGYTLDSIRQRRPDLSFQGVDSSGDFIQSAEKKYPGLNFELENVLNWEPDKKYNLVICTGGLHHLDYDDQPVFLKKVDEMLEKDGVFIFGDPFIDDYSDEKSRKVAAAKMGHEYLASVLKKDAPDSIIIAALNIIHNDVMGFEYKTSVNKIKDILKENFSIESMAKTWPEEESEYGEYLFILKKKK